MHQKRATNDQKRMKRMTHASEESDACMRLAIRREGEKHAEKVTKASISEESDKGIDIRRERKQHLACIPPCHFHQKVTAPSMAV